MATFTTRNGRVTAQIRKVGADRRKRSYAATFGTETEAREWAEAAEEALRRHASGDGPALPSEVAFLPRYDAETCAIGVYFLFRKEECVYVGQSLNVHVRVRSHRCQRNGKKQFDSYSFLRVPADRLDEVEAHYIALLRPQLNEVLNPIRKLKKQLGKTRRPSAKTALRAAIRQASATASATATLVPKGLCLDSEGKVAPIHHRGNAHAPSR